MLDMLESRYVDYRDRLVDGDDAVIRGRAQELKDILSRINS